MGQKGQLPQQVVYGTWQKIYYIYGEVNTVYWETIYIYLNKSHQPVLGWQEHVVHWFVL